MQIGPLWATLFQPLVGGRQFALPLLARTHLTKLTKWPLVGQLQTLKKASYKALLCKPLVGGLQGANLQRGLYVKVLTFALALALARTCIDTNLEQSFAL